MKIQEWCPKLGNCVVPDLSSPCSLIELKTTMVLMPDGDLEFSVTFPVKELEEDDIIESHLIEELEHGRKKKEYYTSIIIIPRIARATMLGFL